MSLWGTKSVRMVRTDFLRNDNGLKLKEEQKLG